jgi:RNA polymerase sigma-70 factor (ECF subfamily)
MKNHRILPWMLRAAAAPALLFATLAGAESSSELAQQQYYNSAFHDLMDHAVPILLFFFFFSALVLLVRAILENRRWGRVFKLQSEVHGKLIDKFSSTRAYLARVSGDPVLADDLMQESYLRFLCALQPPRDETDARRYLFRIATNLLRDHWRRPRPASIEELPAEFFAASANAAQADSQAELGPALARMHPRERQLLWLAHAEGCTHREIAAITGLAAASIRLLLFRARRKIAKLLREQTSKPQTSKPRRQP